MNLNEYWESLKIAEKELLDLNTAWQQETKDQGSLVYSYRLDDIVNGAKETLVRLALKQILAKHEIQNITIPEEVFKKLTQMEGFSTEAIEEAITQPYLAEADTEARAQLMKHARSLIPYLGYDKKATVQDIAKGKRLTLRIRWFMEYVDQSSYGDLYAFQVLLKAHMGNVPLSKCTLGHSSIGETIERFRESQQPFNQARSYVYDDGTIDGFRVYKNGHLEITFKREADTETAAKILLDQPQEG